MSTFGGNEPSDLETRVALLEQLTTTIQAVIASNAQSASAAISTEAASRDDADNALAALLNAEQAARIAGDQTLADQIGALAQAVTAGDAVNFDQVELLASKLQQALGEALAFALWSELEAIDPDPFSYGKAAKVYGPDGDVHIDPVSGAEVQNTGVYGAVPGTGWARIGNLEIDDLKEQVEIGTAWAQGDTPPDPDDPTSKSAKGWADYLADIFAQTFLLGYTSKSGWVHAFLDSTKAVLFGVSTITDELVSNIAARFKAAVTFESDAVVEDAVVLASTPIRFRALQQGAGWKLVVVDNDDRILAGLRNNLRPVIWGQDIPTLNDFGANSWPLTDRVVGLGDSTIQAYGETGVTEQVAEALGVQGYNLGLGGQKSTQIRYRVTPTNITVAGDALPAGDGSAYATVSHLNGVAVVGTQTVQNPDYRFLSYASLTTTNLTGYLLCGAVAVHGTMRRIATGPLDGSGLTPGESYRFIPDAGEPACACQPGSLFVPDDEAQALNSELALSMTRNDYDQIDQNISSIGAVIRWARPKFGMITLFDNLNASTETIGTAQWLTITNNNNRLRDAFPNEYATDEMQRGWRAHFVAQGEFGDANDQIDFGDDVPPRSKRRDDLHPNTAGYAIQTDFYMARRARLYTGV